MLKLLNSKASSELSDGLLEEAQDTATQAVKFYLTNFSAAKLETSHRGKVLLQCHVQHSALLLIKIGAKYHTMGKQRDDTGLVEMGEKLIAKSTSLLKFSRAYTIEPDTPVQLKSAPAKRKTNGK